MIAIVHQITEDELIERHMGLPVSIAVRLWRRDEVKRLGSKEDVVQIAKLALVQAARHYGACPDFSRLAGKAIYRKIERASRQGQRVRCVSLCGDVMDKRPTEDADKEHEKLLKQAMSTLRPRHYTVLKHRWGLGVEPKTLEKIGKMLHVTPQRIKKMESDAIEKVRAWFEARGKDASRTALGFAGDREAPIQEEVCRKQC